MTRPQVPEAFQVIERPKYDDPAEMETALKLLFDVPSEGVTLAKFDWLAFSARANLAKDIRAMTGPAFSAEVFRDRDALWTHLQSLIGRTYLITCEPSESGSWTRITGLVPAKNGTGPERARRKGNGVSKGREKNGDIPF